MEDTAKSIHRLLIRKRKTLSIAESCTGGLLSYLLTSQPGSSAYLNCSIVAYKNSAKEKFLGIPECLIKSKGAVSGEVASRMARSIRKLTRTDLAIGITGIAGPGGGTEKKPLGTVFIAVSAKKRDICKGFRFKGNRNDIQKSAAIQALSLLKAFL